MKQTITEFDVISQAIEILLQRGWCQHAEARDDRGKTCWAFEKKATSFCAIGAILRAEKELSAPAYLVNRIRNRFFRLAGCVSLAYWNDEPSRKLIEVLTLFQNVAAEMRKVSEK